jgi:hypothetical protein
MCAHLRDFGRRAMEYGPSAGIDTAPACVSEPGLMCISGTGARKLNRCVRSKSCVCVCWFAYLCIEAWMRVRQEHARRLVGKLVKKTHTNIAQENVCEQETEHVPAPESLPARRDSLCAPALANRHGHLDEHIRYVCQREIFTLVEGSSFRNLLVHHVSLLV